MRTGTGVFGVAGGSWPGASITGESRRGVGGGSALQSAERVGSGHGSDSAGAAGGGAGGTSAGSGSGGGGAFQRTLAPGENARGGVGG